jgi:alginate O-acetyltransferase complex protein AlgI
VVWGAYHGLFLVVERITGLRRVPEGRQVLLRRLATLLVVVCGWVIFRCDDLGQAGRFFTAMFSATTRDMPLALTHLMDLKNSLLVLFSATTLILPPGAMNAEPQLEKQRFLAAMASVVLFLVLLPWCLAILASGSQNPFIYYRF